MKKSRLEILRGKMRRMGDLRPIRDDMPEEVASSILEEMRQLCPCCGADAAANWSPDSQSREWIDKMTGLDTKAGQTN